MSKRTKETTIRDFGGGLNIVDSDLNLTSKYSKVLDNMYRGLDGSLSLRYGTTLFDDLTGTVTGDILVVKYFSSHLVAVTTTGQVAKITNAGVATAIWNSTIAAALPGAPSGWSTITFASMTSFGGELVVCNGIDKPIIIRTLAGVSELITNGAFPTVTTGWTALLSSTIAVSSAQLLVTNTATEQGGAEQEIAVTDGKTYVISCGYDRDTSAAEVYLYVGTTTGAKNLLELSSTAATGTFHTLFTASGSAAFINVRIKSEAGNLHALFDNISVTLSEVDYLQDLGTLSNVNVPIGRYCATVNRYLIISGIAAEPSTIYITQQDSSGTFVGDAAPNDALKIDLAKYIPTEDRVINGIAQFRGNLLVGFYDATIVGVLGAHDSTGLIHQPTFNEVIEGFGVISHRAIINLGNDVLMNDHIGVQSFARTVYSGTIKPERTSQFIDSLIQAKIINLSIGAMEDLIFGVYNKRENQYMLFVPDRDPYTVHTLGTNPITTGAIGSSVITITETAHGLASNDLVTIAGATTVDGITDTQINTTHTITVITADTYTVTVSSDTATSGTTAGGGASVTTYHEVMETIGYVYTTVPSLKIAAWSRFKGWNWSGGTRSALGRLFFSKGSKIYVYGAEEAKFYGDLIGDSAISDPTNGNGITFDWETPWSDFDNRVALKHTRYIQLDTKGTAEFTMQMYTDNIYKDVNDAYDPYLSMDFVGGDSGGYGDGDQPFGGGRRSADERSWAWTSRFKITKLRVTGSTTKALQIVAISLIYLEGSYQQ